MIQQESSEAGEQTSGASSIRLPLHGVALCLSFVSFVCCLVAWDCDGARSEVRRVGEPPHATIVACRFHSETTGRIVGQVTWSGELPRVPPLQIQVHPFGGLALRARQVRANPNAPVIDPHSRTMASAVIFLRGLAVDQSRPWHHPPVTVEQRAGQLTICQGDKESRFGIVRRGDTVSMLARDEFFYSLHAEGASFFTLVFPQPDQPRRRCLERNGVVELSSGSAYYWMRSYLFVDDHPYYTLTDATGNFCLDQVPPGRYDLVCWLPSWTKARHERDPETGVVCRHFFKPPVERVQPITVAARTTQEARFEISGEMFAPP